MVIFTDNSLSFAGLISMGKSSGSGFIYRSEKFVYLITAKHVLYDKQGLLWDNNMEILFQSFNDPSKNSRCIIDLKLNVPTYHKSGDVAVIQLGKVDNISADGTIKFSENIGVEFIDELIFTPIAAVEKLLVRFKKLSVGSDIYIIAYPTSLGILSSPQIDNSQPLLRKGIIANFNHHLSTIILDCPVYQGNSGAPVIQVINHTLQIVGIISQYVPYQQTWINYRDQITNVEHMNSGYSIATTIDDMLELISQSEITK